MSVVCLYVVRILAHVGKCRAVVKRKFKSQIFTRLRKKLNTCPIFLMEVSYFCYHSEFKLSFHHYCELRVWLTLRVTACRRSSGHESRGRRLDVRCCLSPGNERK